MRYLKICALTVIIIGSYLGLRYIGALIHYSCAEPGADGPPPICLSAELAFVLTGGDLLPLWTRD